MGHSYGSPPNSVHYTTLLSRLNTSASLPLPDVACTCGAALVSSCGVDLQ